MHLYQVPVTGTQAGLYVWIMTSYTKQVTGHVVVRGVNAGPIGEWNYPQGTETWYSGSSKSYQGDPSFDLTLSLMRDPGSQTLIDAIGAVRKNETEVGISAEVPKWQQGAPLPGSPQVVTLTDVVNGPGEYTDLYTKVSFLMPIDGDPVMPTWYTSDQGLYSVFGGSSSTGAPIKEGIEAKMTSVGSGKPGYPNANSWYWYGRDPR